MPSISIFFGKHSLESKIKDELLKLTDFTLIKDSDLINDASTRFSSNVKKLKKTLYQKTSVFNKFTLERELQTAYLKNALAKRLTENERVYYGFHSLLIPKAVSHVLRVLLVDTKAHRILRSIETGIEPKHAEKELKNCDMSAFHWAEFLFDSEPWNKALYDIVIPIKKQSPKEIASFIIEQCAQGSLLETQSSAQAVADMLLASEIEVSLLKNGQKVDIDTSNGEVKLSVNKSVLNFNSLRRELEDHVSTIEGVKKVEVIMGRDYHDSIYRDQEFKLPPKVLLVDDEKDFVLTLSERLISRNVGTYTVYDGKEALDFLSEDQPDVMILDLKMPGISGLTVLEETKKNNPEIEIIILTGHGTEEDKKNCLELGAFAYLQKPTDIKTLSETIHQAHTHKP